MISDVLTLMESFASGQVGPVWVLGMGQGPGYGASSAIHYSGALLVQIPVKSAPLFRHTFMPKPLLYLTVDFSHPSVKLGHEAVRPE